MTQSFFELSDRERRLGDMGRRIMDMAVTEKDDALANRMSVVGNMLTTVGAPFGTKITEITAEDKQFVIELGQKNPKIYG